MTIKPEVRASTELKMQLRACSSQQEKRSVSPRRTSSEFKGAVLFCSTPGWLNVVFVSKSTNIDLKKLIFKDKLKETRASHNYKMAVERASGPVIYQILECLLLTDGTSPLHLSGWVGVLVEFDACSLSSVDRAISRDSDFLKSQQASSFIYRLSRLQMADLFSPRLCKCNMTKIKIESENLMFKCGRSLLLVTFKRFYTHDFVPWINVSGHLQPCDLSPAQDKCCCAVFGCL